MGPCTEKELETLQDWMTQQMAGEPKPMATETHIEATDGVTVAGMDMVTQQEVRRALRKLDASSSRGPDAVSPKVLTIPGLLYADDLVLISEEKKELQEMLNQCGKFAEERGLQFNTKKSAILSWDEKDDGIELTVQGTAIPYQETYTYLGIDIATTQTSLQDYEQKIRAKAQQAIKYLNRMARWSFHYPLVLRELWKTVVVPTITYANGAVCIYSNTREFLERKQREIGRMALRGHRSSID
ncbi:uncharacterized protein LOC135367541 [Ornithodoros turicata]|uniref:uncharacterized protein LOC135367541 n=1 Tax=Ornithodoros turicata TaxID=34597 RepID=UPI00313A3B71